MAQSVHCRGVYSIPDIFRRYVGARIRRLYRSSAKRRKNRRFKWNARLEHARNGKRIASVERLDFPVRNFNQQVRDEQELRLFLRRWRYSFQKRHVHLQIARSVGVAKRIVNVRRIVCKRRGLFQYYHPLSFRNVCKRLLQGICKQYKRRRTRNNVAQNDEEFHQSVCSDFVYGIYGKQRRY